MSLIDDIKRDREAGTPGPWALETVPTSCGVCHKIGEWPSRGQHKFSSACVYEDYPPTTLGHASEPQSNARRIARVPELEAAVLAAEDLAEAVDARRNAGSSICYDDAFELETAALAAYRKATGGKQ